MQRNTIFFSIDDQWLVFNTNSLLKFLPHKPYQLKMKTPTGNHAQHVAKVMLLADGERVEEYFSKKDHDGSFCTWVPVRSGQKISVDCDFSGSCNRFCMDLIVDGILRNSFYSHSFAGHARHVFNTAYYTHDGRVKAKMVVKDLPSAVLPQTTAEGKRSIGTVEIRVYVEEYSSRRSHLQTTPTFEASECWTEGYRAPAQSPVAPTQEIVFIGSENRASIGKWQFGHDSRAGWGPWAVFRFFYRTAGK